jgi:hypothetical protein
MGALAAFIEREFAGAPRKPEIETRGAAIAAIPAIPEPRNSRNSKNSREPIAKFNPEALQREADRRNALARQARLTDRFCRCGQFAESAWPDANGREIWRCFECLEPGGRA